MRRVHLFHYHLVTSQVRTVEARYLGKLGFRLVARYGRVGERAVTAEPGVPWEQLERDGFKLRLTEVQRGALNVVLQPGLWRVPRVDHVGVVHGRRGRRSTLAVLARDELEPAGAGAQQPAHVHLHRRRLPDRGAPAAAVDRGAARRRATSSSSASSACARASRTRRPRALADILDLDAAERRVGPGRRRASSGSSPAGPRAGPSCTRSGSTESNRFRSRG